MSGFSKPPAFFAPATPCRVHGLEVEGRDCGEAAAQWITSFLKTQPYRLVHFEPHLRPRYPHQMMDVFQPTDQVRGASLGFGLWCVQVLSGVQGPSGRAACPLSSALSFCQAAPRQFGIMNNRQK